MRSPVITSDLQTPFSASEATSEASNQQDEVRTATQFPLDKTESDSDSDDEETTFEDLLPSSVPTRDQEREKQERRAGGFQQLMERARRRRRSLQEQSNGGEAAVATASPDRRSDVGSFAVEIESEAAEIRTLIARTARLWSAVDRAERRDMNDLEMQQRPQLQTLETTSTFVPVRSDSLSEQYLSAEDGEESTLSSDVDDDLDEEEDGTETESVGDLELQRIEDVDGFLAQGAMVTSLVNGPHELESHELNGDSDIHGSESPLDLPDNAVGNEIEDLDLEQGEVMDASNRAINASKARAIKNAMLGNLLRLGFHETVTRAALEAGILEIDHYDSDCELAYVDIFMSLVKMVCDAHVDVMHGGEENWMAAVDHSQESYSFAPPNLEQRSFLPFKWPVFDMAQFEFGNARPGTCFNSVCVLTNLPKVSMDRTEELMEVLSCNLFCMIGDPIQVVIPSASSTGRTKGHAFLEFDDPEMSRRCASAVDGLTWGRGPFGRIRGNLFRQYQVKSPAEEHRQTDVERPGAILARNPFMMNSPAIDARRIERFTPPERRMVMNVEAQQHNLYCDSDEEESSDGEWVVSPPVEYAPFNPTVSQTLSADSMDIREQNEIERRDDLMMPLGWGERAVGDEFEVHFANESGNEHDESFNSASERELQAPDLLEQPFFDEVAPRNGYLDARCHMSSPPLGVAPNAESFADGTAIECVLPEFPWNAPSDGDDDVEKPWRRYCEDLIHRNRELQEQVAFARRRIVQLSHNNQKLNLLIDRVERDRDGLLFENDLLQTQLHGYEDHEEHHDSLMKELLMLRKHLKQKEQTFDARSVESRQQLQHLKEPQVGGHTSLQSTLNHLTSATLVNLSMNELKACEHLLEKTLGRVRSAKEEKALEMQKKLDRQVEEQNELKLCVICLSNEKSILCLPCRHLCLCKTCSSREELTRCPICRLEIEEMLAVYS